MTSSQQPPPPTAPDLVWQALNTEHAHLSHGDSTARRYHNDVAPFAAFKSLTTKSLHTLSQYAKPDEQLLVSSFDPLPPLPAEWQQQGDMQIAQMVLTEPLLPDESKPDRIQLMTDAEVSDMLELTTLAFPEFFRANTHRMGAYYGIYRDKQLIAMGGERFVGLPYREVSGICTHPKFVRQGLAGQIIRHVCHQMTLRGEYPLLHVSCKNLGAIALYEKLGFKVTTTFTGYMLRRQPDQNAADAASK